MLELIPPHQIGDPSVRPLTTRLPYLSKYLLYTHAHTHTNQPTNQQKETMSPPKANILLIGSGGVGTIAALNLEAGNLARVTAVLRSNYHAVTSNGFNITSCDHGILKGWKPSTSKRLTQCQPNPIPCKPTTYTINSNKPHPGPNPGLPQIRLHNLHHKSDHRLSPVNSQSDQASRNTRPHCNRTNPKWAEHRNALFRRLPRQHRPLGHKHD